MVLAVALTGLAGCAPRGTLQIEPVKRAVPIAPKFTQSYYFWDRDSNLYFVMRAQGAEPGTGRPVTQVATIRVFWHPRGGVTTLNKAALNATMRYLVMTPDSLGLYEGAGFVRLYSKDGKSPFRAQVMDSDLRLTQASATYKDTLGRSRMRGVFKADWNDAAGTELLLDAQREFFARSLNSKPEGAPATAPATDDFGMPAATQAAPTTQP